MTTPNYVQDYGYPRDELEDDFMRGVMRMLLGNPTAVPVNLYLHNVNPATVKPPTFNGEDWVEFLDIPRPDWIYVMGNATELIDFYEKVGWVEGPQVQVLGSRHASQALVNEVKYVDAKVASANGTFPVYKTKPRNKAILLLCKSFLMLEASITRAAFTTYASTYRNVHLFDIEEIGMRYKTMRDRVKEAAAMREAITRQKFRLGRNGVFEWAIDDPRMER